MFSKRKILTAVVFLIGFSLCSYPIISGMIKRQYSKDTVATYEELVEQADEDSLQELIKKAQNYNEVLYEAKGFKGSQRDVDILSEKQYDSLLNLSGDGMIGSIEIPVIDVDLPIYHGTSEKVLSSAVGHVKNSSLPIGGKNTRAILAGHRGLPSAKLFTRLDELKKGDLFFVHIFHETLAYEIQNIEIIEPDEVEKLQIVPEEDLVTLLTCTPYGINSHRLIITGRRAVYQEDIHKTIQRKIPSSRELFFTAIPFVVIGLVIIKVTVDRKR